MKYTQKSFSVPAVGERKECEHGWPDRRGLCVFCGNRLYDIPDWTEIRDGRVYLKPEREEK